MNSFLLSGKKRQLRYCLIYMCECIYLSLFETRNSIFSLMDNSAKYKRIYGTCKYIKINTDIT